MCMTVGSQVRSILVVVLNLPPTWIRGYLRRADQNQDGKMSYDEVKTLLQMINIDLSEQYALSLFKVRQEPTHCFFVSWNEDRRREEERDRKTDVKTNKRRKRISKRIERRSSCCEV